MIKVLTASLLTLAVSSSVLLPAMADETVTESAGTTTSIAANDAKPAATSKSADEKKKDSSASNSKSGGSDTKLGARLCSFVTGCTVGIPISMVRRTGSEIAQGSKDLLGDTNNWFFIVPAGVITVPFGTVSGVFGGTLYGIKNAWVGSGEEPFGKDSFSLGDM